MTMGDTPYAIVLAGGVGSRLWPYSRRARPKQLLPLLEGRSMLQAALARLEGEVPPERIFVLTNADYAEAVRQQAPALPPEQVVGEPSALGTAAAVGLGAALVRARDPQGVMAVVTADHRIAPVDSFQAALRRAIEAAREGWLVTFGIRPTGPETGFGYIELGAALPGAGGQPGASETGAVPRPDPDPDPDPDPLAVRRVLRFVEKPDRSRAEAYLASGNFVWNSGMFAWGVPAIFEAYARLLPELGERLDEIVRGLRGGGRVDAVLAEIWPRIETRTTIDYGILERSERVACVPADFGWTDLGSWAAVAELLVEDRPEDANVGRGARLDVDSRGCLVYGTTDRLVATIGLRDLVIVDTGDALLVCPRDRAQEVKDIVKRLDAEGRADLL